MDIESLKQKLVAAEVARDAAQDAITVEEREEMEVRRALEQADEDRRAAELAKLELELDRWTEAAREEHGPDAKIVSIIIDGYDDAFVVMHSSKDFVRWEEQHTKAVNDKRVDKAKVSLDYSVASVICWNGETDFSLANENASVLRRYLQKNRGMVTSINNAAAKLAGAFTEARKS